MKIRSPFLRRLHLDTAHYLLTMRGVHMALEFFNALDVRQCEQLDDVQFLCFMRSATDLNDKQIYKVFDMFDVDASGTIEFNEFYLLICMLIAIKDHVEKQFLWHHTRTCFDLLDADGNKGVTIQEFDTFAFIFNISRRASQHIFEEFDVDESRALDYEEFRLFTLACIDEQYTLEMQGGTAPGQDAVCRIM